MTEQETDERTAAEKYLDSGRRVKTGTGGDGVETIDPGALADEAFGKTSSSARTPAGKVSSGADSNRQRLVREASTRPENEIVGAPEVVEKAWGQVIKAAQDAQDAERAWLKGQHAQERARKAQHDAVADAVEKTGKAPSEAGQRKAAQEFADELDRLHATWVGLARRVGAARSAYDAEVTRHREEWATALLAEVEPQRKAAASALRSALTSVQSLAAVVSGARTHHATSLREAGAESVRGIQPFNAYSVTDSIEAALGAIAGDEPWRLVDLPVNDLSMQDRALIVQESARGTLETARRRWLDEVEKSEKFTITKDGKPVAKSA